ncbi:MAG: sulfotransferase [Sphingomicrobium sp.]
MSDGTTGAGEAAVQFDRGVLLENSNDPNGARSAYQRAVALDPGQVEALASLAWLDAQAGDSRSARTWGERALALDRLNVLARMALAFAELQDEQLDAAGNRLVQLYADPALTAVNRSIVLGLIGDLNDAQGDAARAFKAYDAANAQLKALYAAFEGPGRETALGHARRLIDWFQTANSKPWREPLVARAKAGDPKVHMFLVGFPRSGTTLLETVLAGHPEVVTLEEKDSLAQAAHAYLSSNEGLERLASISTGEALRQRDAYWSVVRGFGVEPRRRVFIDKMPLATVLLPMISQIFPNARVLFAVRDPRDVVLSCFRRRFGMNAAMYELLTLDGAAAYYDAVMSLADAYRALLPIPLHIVRYESLIEDFEGTARAACDFAGLDWIPAMADIAATARARGITTPSAAQLARGLNRDGQGTWRRYREQMVPVLPVLEPWVKRFGYDSN